MGTLQMKFSEFLGEAEKPKFTIAQDVMTFGGVLKRNDNINEKVKTFAIDDRWDKEFYIHMKALTADTRLIDAQLDRTTVGIKFGDQENAALVHMCNYGAGYELTPFNSSEAFLKIGKEYIYIHAASNVYQKVNLISVDIKIQFRSHEFHKNPEYSFAWVLYK